MTSTTCNENSTLLLIKLAWFIKKNPQLPHTIMESLENTTRMLINILKFSNSCSVDKHLHAHLSSGRRFDCDNREIKKHDLFNCSRECCRVFNMVRVGLESIEIIFGCKCHHQCMSEPLP